MSLMADALQPLMVRDLLTIGRRLEPSSIPDAIMLPRAAYDLDFDNVGRRIIFDFRDSGLVVTSTASDCCRLSGSAFQTVASVGGGGFEKNALPWEIFKLYYSAFYSGQTIIRILGESCSFFDNRHVSRIDSLGKAIGKAPGFTLDAGLYRCIIDSTATKLSCTRLSGGSHETFWRVFGEIIELATENVLRAPLVPNEAQAVFAQLEAFTRLIRRHGSYGWLSTLRNDLQYRHYHDIWFPSRIGKRDLGTLRRLASLWKSDPMALDLDAVRFGLLGEFVVACTFIVSVCRVLVIRIAELAPHRRSFLHYGPLQFIG
jgi:hypothetical protein